MGAAPCQKLCRFLLQVLDLLPDRGLDLVLIEIDRKSAPLADCELVYVHDDEPSAVSLREALGERLLASLQPSVTQLIAFNISTPLSRSAGGSRTSSNRNSSL
jgi:hypothetical protein